MPPLRLSLWRRALSAAAASKSSRGGGSGGLSDPFPPGRFETILIDRSKLLRPAAPAEPPASEQQQQEQQQQQSEGVVALRKGIELAGRPLSIAAYMRQALLNPRFGFYTRDRGSDDGSAPADANGGSKDASVFGEQGHFVTSPHISQMFGELCGIWVLHLWLEQGRPKPFAIVEFGPGMGKLMQDLLRGLAAFPEFLSCLSVHMIEASPALQKAQAQALGCDSDSPAIGQGGPTRSTAHNVPISWHKSWSEVALSKAAVFIAHEFFDALPIHKFQRTERGWCEVMVDKAPPTDRSPFRYTLSPGPTPAALSYVTHRLSDPELAAADKAEGGLQSLEYCPEAALLATKMADHVAAYGGGALVVDYGEEGPIRDSFMGICNHEIVDDILEHDPGSIDLSADVDFGAIRLAIKAHFDKLAVKHHLVQRSKRVETARTLGPISQRTFLERMGIHQRLAQLIQGKPEDVARRLSDGVQRLLGSGSAGMGERYKVMAIVPSSSPAPAAFERGGDSRAQDG